MAPRARCVPYARGGRSPEVPRCRRPIGPPPRLLGPTRAASRGSLTASTALCPFSCRSMSLSEVGHRRRCACVRSCNDDRRAHAEHANLAVVAHSLGVRTPDIAPGRRVRSSQGVTRAVGARQARSNRQKNEPERPLIANGLELSVSTKPTTGRDGMDETVVMFYVCIFLGGIVYTFHKVDTWIFRSQNRNMV